MASPVSLRLWVRWALLIAGWTAFLVSLPAPAFRLDGWFSAMTLPVYATLLVMWAIWPMFPLWVATICFVASPFSAAARARRRVGVLWSILRFGMLAVWVPPLVDCFVATQDRFGALWGYYLLASSYTLACAAALIPSPRGSRADQRRGFPVVVEPREQQHG